jgi:hypothetical protein
MGPRAFGERCYLFIIKYYIVIKFFSTTEKRAVRFFKKTGMDCPPKLEKSIFIGEG